MNKDKINKKQNKRDKQNKKDNQKQKQDNSTQTQDKNVIRNLSDLLKPSFDKLIGSYYGLIHIAFMFLGGIILLFSNNIMYLSIMLFIVSLDAFANVVNHNCPLTLMEEKYLGISGKEISNIFYKQAGIMYTCNHIYETQLELLINVWILLACKILAIIFMRIVKINIIST
jgi:hypothetical protein